MKQRPPNRESWAATLRANAAQASAGRKPRGRVLAVVDAIAGVVLSVFALGLAIVVSTSATQLLGVHEECTPAQVDGLTCNGTVLGVVSIALTAIAILGFVIAAGMVLVNLIRRRWTFWWPLGAIVLIVGLFYLGAWLIGLTIPAVAS